MRLWIITVVACWLGPVAGAQSLTEPRPFEDGYDNELLYVHALANYAFDLAWQFDWERTQFSKNAVRVNTGSVSSRRLLTDIDLSINQALNEKWRFRASFMRDGQRQRPVTREQLLLGFERTFIGGSALFVTVNPEYDKSLLDIEIGYARYFDQREQYVRFSLLLDDLNYSTKNVIGGVQDQDPLQLQWQARIALTQGWFAYTQGRVGRGFERRFEDVTLSPQRSATTQRDNHAEIRFSKRFADGRLWSFWGQWAQFEASRTLRDPGGDFDYDNEEWNLAVEHVRVFGKRHRGRVLAQYVERQAASRGFNAHDFSRRDVIGGAFYEYLRNASAYTLGYVFGLPDYDYVAFDPIDSYANREYTDKFIVGWRYQFSKVAQVRASISHELSASGFGGGAVQFQMTF
ncbi:MAG: hypothetical protein AB8G17_08120 [Gammaproteobacteria bacterium]